MRVRGSVINGIDSFVQERFPDRYDEWNNALSEESKEIYNKPTNSAWYPTKEGIVDPTRLMCSLFFSNEKEGAWESGSYSAEVALTGIYKIFVLVSSPSFIMKRAGRILPTFYEDAKIAIIESTDSSMILRMEPFPIKDTIVEFRIAGWMEKAMEICGCKDLDVQVTQSAASGDGVTEVRMTWK